MADFNTMFPQFLQQALQLKSLLTPVAYLLPAACFVLVGLYAQWGHQLKDAT